MRRTRNRVAMTAAALLVALGAATGIAAPHFTSSPASATTAPPPRVGWWAGQTAGLCNGDILSCPRDNSSYTPAVWDALVAGHGFLGFDLVYTSDFGPTVSGVNRRTDALPVIHEANLRGVPISAWITVPTTKGTFANENNAATIQDAVKSFATWASANQLTFDEVVLDVEVPLGYQPFVDAIQSGDPSGIEALMSANINPGHQCAAAKTTRDTITWAHQHGIKLTSAPILMAMDDLADGSTALQDALDLTAFPPFGYDMQYLQAYRAVGVDLGSGVVASYFAKMKQNFGGAGQVSLGNTGTAPYDKVGTVVDDIRMLSALGASRIPIFDFDSTVKTFGAGGVAAILDAANHPMSPAELATAQQVSQTGAAAFALFRTLDDFATGATPWVTAANFRPQAPNSYPNGCGDVTAVPLP